MTCDRCGHELEAHEVIGHEEDREILECVVTACRCLLLEGET